MSLLPSIGVDIYPPWKKHKLTVTIIGSSWLEGAYTMTGLCVKLYGKASLVPRPSPGYSPTFSTLEGSYQKDRTLWFWSYALFHDAI